MEIEKLRKIRSSEKGSITKLINKIDKASTDNVSVNNLKALLNQLNTKIENVKSIDDSILKETDLKLFDAEIDGIQEYHDNLLEYKTNLIVKIEELSGNNRDSNINEGVNVSSSNYVSNQSKEAVTIKLPKLSINKFYGDSSNWLEFIGQFENAIDKNTSLSKIEKLIYLKSFLGGSAAKAIAGISLTETNYEAALELLRKRYGQTNILINSHLGQLLSISPVKNPNDVSGLRKLLDHTEIQIRNLKALKIDSDSYGNILTPLILKLLPNEFVLDYSREIKDDNWDLNGLLEFLKNEILSRERAGSINYKSVDKATRFEKPVSHPFKSKPSPVKINKPSAVELLTTSADAICIFCKGSSHSSADCDAISLENKKELLKKEARCMGCLQRFHKIKECKQKINCGHCQKKHSKAICYSLHQKRDSDETEKKSDTNVVSAVSSYNSDEYGSNKILLQTACALIRNKDKQKNVRILFDNGSMRTFITKDVARKMNLPIIRKESLSVFAFGDKSALEKTFNVVKAKLENIKDPNLSIDIEFLETESISNTIISSPDLSFAKENKILKNLQLADCCKNNGKIDILIGVDVYYSIITGKIKRISKDVVATESLFGWCLQGKMNENVSELLTMKVIVSENLISNQLEQFWKLENLGLESDTQDDKAADLEIMKSFESDIKYKNGRYQVGLPWKPNSKHLMENNKDVALERFQKLNNKFKIDNPLFIQYKEVLKDYALKNIIEPVQEDNRNDNTLFYLPHRAVIRNDRSTSKLRIVYDASAHKQNKLSLNDCLYTGPNLYPDIFDLLIKFRQNLIAFTADITQAFLQIELNEEDRDVTRFFWKDDPFDNNENLKTFRFTRVLFGVKSSPFLLAATIKYHLKRYTETYPETVELLDNSLYVDDIIGGQQNLEQAVKTCLEIVNIFKDASMSLHKWHTNSNELKNIWHQKNFSILESPEIVPIKVLGISWNTDNDNLYFDTQHLTNFISSPINSKRFLLQTAGRIFDPVGFYGPFTIRIKCLIQEIWSAKIDWDDELPFDLSCKWKAWYEEIEELNHLKIPRYYLEGVSEADVRKIELHSFSDSSLKAYGCVVYLRIVLNNDTFKTVFVASKSRVAPLKNLTLPRLELLGALLSARLSNKIAKCLKYKVTPFHWTDSQITYFWVSGCSERFKPFVKNRVDEIQKLTESSNWRFCPGKDNPADIISRGTTVSNLRKCQLWWQGPPWLLKSTEFWPSGEVEIIEEENLEYRKKFADTQQYECVIQEKEELIDISKYSNLIKILKVTAWIKRFTRKIRKLPIPTGILSAEEFKEAEEFWIRSIQREAYNSEVSALETGKNIAKKSSIFSLSPYLDDKGILRLGGRLEFSDLTIEEKHPILLPRNSKFTELIVRNEHEKMMHFGVTATLNSIRKEYWIPKGRQLVKKIIANCLICRKYSAKPAQQMTAPLPKDRIVETPPFVVTGVDFAGPIYVKSANGTDKTYIALFTCAVTRAIHLELVSNMSTESFLMAFRRFVSRRGHCQTVYSDNAKTFQKVNRQFENFSKILQDSKFQDFIACKKINWKFIIERGAWWGGFYERLVKSVKDCLRKILGKALLNFEELNTVLTEIEYVINQRPLTYVYSDLEEPEPLTPLHFLNFGRKSHSYPLHFIELIEKNSNKTNLLKRQEYQIRLLQHLWKKWKRQYLLDLRTTHHLDIPNPSKEIKIGDVVLLEGSTKSKLLWELGVISELFKGRDNHVRSCLIKTSRGHLKRPIQLLYPLEVVDEL